MKRILLFALLVMFSAFTLRAQDVIRVAVLKTVDEVGDVSPGVKLNLRATLTNAINRMPGFEAYTRVNMSAIMDEHKFQRSGFVSDKEIREIGKATGAKYILIAEVAYYDENNITVTASIVDIETTKLKLTADPVISPIDREGMRESCIQIARSLLNMRDISIKDTLTIIPPGGGNSISNKEYTETAFDINMRMIYVDGGTFMMGCTDEQSKCDEDEKNVRRVTVDGFYIGMMEISQAQWEKVMGESMDSVVNRLRTEYRWVAEYDEPGWWKEGDTVWPSPFCEGEEHLKVSRVGQNYPICLIRQYEALEFCKKLSEKTGKKYTLPTEAQWEYAARGGNKASRGYNGGNINDVAWYSGNSKGLFHVCGSKGPNALGIYDMLGNVSEWCSDFYVESYLNYETVNPMGPKEADDDMYPDHVIRGGCYESDAKDCRVSRRQYDTEQAFSKWLGFRVVCIP